jgi:hypothetical protein
MEHDNKKYNNEEKGKDLNLANLLQKQKKLYKNEIEVLVYWT